CGRGVLLQCAVGFRVHRSPWLLVFFFSSRRRHTRFSCDWSSDVCSSDLRSCRKINPATSWGSVHRLIFSKILRWVSICSTALCRSEERRVGTECRVLWSEYYGNKR